MPRRKKKKKLFYFGVKSNGKHSAQDINRKKEKENLKSIEKKRLDHLEKQNKIEEKQKKKEEKERIKRIENKNKEIRKNKKKETKEELKNNKYTNRKNDDEIFDFDKEVVLGINNNIIKKVDKKKAKSKNTKKKVKKKNKKLSVIVKCTSLLGIIIGTTIIGMTSSVFNITEIVVEGNNGVQKETIIHLSGVQIGENIFKINTKNIISNIKNNTYIKNVEINRELPTTLKIKVNERNSKYMLECAGNYIYIDNQGYLLELTEVALDVPIITGAEATEEELLEIKRLGTRDLSKLSDVLKITETANSYKLYQYIDKIDVTNSKDYIVYMQEFDKTIHIGDTSDLNNKLLHLREILSNTEGKSGSIFINGNLNEGFKPYFRENI